MKNILVAIDFSKGSLQAYKYAVKLAQKANAELTIVWVDNQVVQQSLYTPPVNDVRNEAKNRLEDLIKKQRGKLKGKIKYKLRKGKVHQEVQAVAKAIKADMIVAGTHGGSGYEKLWIGSNAYRIVIHAPCPVITVKYDAEARAGINRIVMPVDSSSETLQKLVLTAKIAKLFKAEVHVLALLEDKLKALRMKAESNARLAIKYLAENNIDHVYSSMDSDNATETIIDYTLNVHANLISIMTEQNASGTNALLGPNARLIVNQSPIPVLSSQPSQNH
jgi:nucleotide-binding universal stress UspA family protein